MKKLFTIVGLFIVAVAVYSQSASECTLYEVQYEEFKANFEQAKSDKEKSRWLTQLERTLEDAMSIGCDFIPEKSKEFNKLKKSYAANASLLAQSAYTVAAEANVVKIGVKHKKNLQITDKPDWMELLEREDDTKNLDFSVEENPLPYPRTGIVEISDGGKRYPCSITQVAAPLQANVSDRIGFGQDGGIGSIFVETNDTAWTVSGISGDNSWISTEVTDYGAKVICTANPTKQRRSSIVYIHLAYGETKEVNINQVIGRTTLSVPQKSYTFSNKGDINNAVVKCNYDQWSATTDAKWLKVKKKYGGISIECSPNKIAASRTAKIKIETNDADHLVEYIDVTQLEAYPYISAEQSSYYSDGYPRTIKVKVNTNIPNWSYSVDQGSRWTTASSSGDYLNVNLKRNDENSSRTSEVRLYGKGKSYTVSLTQPNRGYEGRYHDYFDANGGDWRIIWIEADAHVMTTIGVNIATMNARWKPVELSLLNFNIEYNFLWGESVFGWEPVVRGFLPISRDGKWAAFAGIGAHVGFGSYSAFLFEFGMDCNWNKKYSSRMFFKYNGGCSLGMSFGLGSWY